MQPIERVKRAAIPFLNSRYAIKVKKPEEKQETSLQVMRDLREVDVVNSMEAAQKLFEVAA